MFTLIIYQPFIFFRSSVILSSMLLDLTPSHTILDVPYTLMLDDQCITIGLMIMQNCHSFGITITNDSCVLQP